MLIYIKEHDVFLTEKENIILKYIVEKFKRDQAFFITYEKVIELLFESDDYKKYRLSACKILNSMQNKKVLHRYYKKDARLTDSELSIKLAFNTL